MKTKLRMFLGAFLTTAILIGAMCGFMLVDLSTEKYMPGRSGPMFLIYSADGQGMSFSFMGEDYLLSARPLRSASAWLEPLRSLRPLPVQVAEAAGAGLWALLEDLTGEPEEAVEDSTAAITESDS